MFSICDPSGLEDCELNLQSYPFFKRSVRESTIYGTALKALYVFMLILQMRHDTLESSLNSIV
jgi:hypothetical protein